jgi:hypothetical protein
MCRPMPVVTSVLLLGWMTTPATGCGVLMTHAVGFSGCSATSGPAASDRTSVGLCTQDHRHPLLWAMLPPDASGHVQLRLQM